MLIILKDSYGGWLVGLSRGSWSWGVLLVTVGVLGLASASVSRRGDWGLSWGALAHLGGWLLWCWLS